LSEKHTFLLLWAEDFLDFKDCVVFLLLPIPIITFKAHWIEKQLLQLVREIIIYSKNKTGNYKGGTS